MLDEVPFGSLTAADLVVDRIYRGGSSGNVGDDPLGRLLPVGNMGGFRYSGSHQHVKLVVLYTSGEHVDWPDSLDQSTGTFTYFGDNREPGRDLHNTPRKGNEILRTLFECASGDEASRAKVPPIFVFSKGAQGRDVIFRGLAVPGSTTGRIGDDLVAVWRTSGDRRFQNYRATFTILDEPSIRRDWISSLEGGKWTPEQSPSTLRRWVSTGIANPLISERINIRSKEEQLPDSPRGWDIIGAVHEYFNVTIRKPTDFEKCAVDLWRTSAPSTGNVNLTQPWRDGGRDALGVYGIGPVNDRLMVEFALEAKCYKPGSSIGVREMSRLISRLRHRQFGVFITTSYFNRQAYLEVREDQHPVVLMSARDAVSALETFGVTNGRDATEWLRLRYPPSPR